MKIGILETGRPPLGLRAAWGTYADMCRGLLGADRSFQTYDVQRGDLPTVASECHAYIVTGSAAGVYEDRPWIPPLLEFLRQARGRAKLVGICFGHQAMAQAFGGEVIKSPKGWGLGLHRYAVVDPAAGLAGADFAIPAFHQDQVVSLPPNAQTVAATEFTPFAALAYGDEAISVQGHPEFSTGFSAALIEAQRTLYGPHAAPALETLRGEADCSRVGTWMQRFVDKPSTGR